MARKSEIIKTNIRQTLSYVRILKFHSSFHGRFLRVILDGISSVIIFPTSRALIFRNDIIKIILLIVVKKLILTVLLLFLYFLIVNSRNLTLTQKKLMASAARLSGWKTLKTAL